VGIDLCEALRTGTLAKIKSALLEFSVLYLRQPAYRPEPKISPGSAVWHNRRTAPDIRLGDKLYFENG
ncbi:uncharacterized protein METZ01_LOCUS91064, partial [marine metagenome]